MQIKLIFAGEVFHLASFWRRVFLEPGNGLILTQPEQPQSGQLAETCLRSVWVAYKFLQTLFCSELLCVRSVTQDDLVRADAKDIPRIFQVCTLTFHSCVSHAKYFKRCQCKTQTANCGPGIKCRLSVNCSLQTESKTQTGAKCRLSINCSRGRARV